MDLFGRWRNRGDKAWAKTHNNRGNNKSLLIGNKQGLFDDIVGFGEVKSLFEMAIKAERPVHLLLCGPPSSGKSLFMTSLTRLEGLTMQLEGVLQNQEYLIICLSIDHAILSLMNLKK